MRRASTSSGCRTRPTSSASGSAPTRSASSRAWDTSSPGRSRRTTWSRSSSARRRSAASRWARTASTARTIRAATAASCSATSAERENRSPESIAPATDRYDECFAEDLLAVLRPPFFLAGTLPPALRASDRPIAIACLRLFTVLPERPLFSVPCLRSCIAFSTFSDALLPYAAMKCPRFVERGPSPGSRRARTRIACGCSAQADASVRCIACSPCSIIPAIAAACSSGRKSAIQTMRHAPPPSGNACALALWWLRRPPTTDHATPLGVDRDDQLARDEPIGERDDARARLEPAVGDEAADEPRVQRADVGERVPDVGGRTLDDDLAMHRSHHSSASAWPE